MITVIGSGLNERDIDDMDSMRWPQKPGAWGYREGYEDGKRSGLVTGSLVVFIPSLLALVIWWSMHKLAGG